MTGHSDVGRTAQTEAVAATFAIRPKGPFSLEEAGNFGFGQRMDAWFDGVMRLAFCLDGYRTQVGVSVRQEADGSVVGTVAHDEGVGVRASNGRSRACCRWTTTARRSRRSVGATR
jgi:hypothetical protein